MDRQPRLHPGGAVAADDAHLAGWTAGPDRSARAGPIRPGPGRRSGRPPGNPHGAPRLAVKPASSSRECRSTRLPSAVMWRRAYG